MNSSILKTLLITATIFLTALFILFVGDLVNGYVDQVTLQSQLTNWRTIMQPVYDAGIDDNTGEYLPISY